MENGRSKIEHLGEGLAEVGTEVWDCNGGEKTKEVLEELLTSPPLLDLLRSQMEMAMSNPDHIKAAIDCGLIEVLNDTDPDTDR